MATTTAASTPLGSYKATVRYSKELMVRAQRQRSMHRRLSGKLVDVTAALEGRVDTSHGYPVVQAYDLMKNDGDRITFDIVNRVGGAPTMGDEIAGDSASPIVFERDEVVIQQARKVISAGGRMAQQRTPHNLRSIAMSLSLNYINNYEDNLFHVHLAGARGYQTGQEWPLPLASDPNFASYAINPVLPPRRSRLAFPNAITTIASLTTADKLTLNFYDNLYTRAITGPVPLKGVNMGEGWGGDDSSPLLLSIISQEQWNQLKQDTSSQNWRNFLAQANERLNYKKHPLFQDVELGLWGGVVIMKTARAIEFPAGSSVQEYDTNGVLQTVTAAVRTHRGVLIGAEALGLAYGSAKPINLGGYKTGSGQTEQLGSYSWVEEVKDGGNLLQTYVGMMAGMKKLQYTFDGTVYDNGVIAFDTYVPSLTP